MIDRLRHATLFALYQLSIVLGIVLLPIALVFGRFGLRLPLDRLVRELGEAAKRTQPRR